MKAYRRRRMRLCIQGTVQGVGFRPHVYGLATQLGLSGFVFNDDKGVVIEVEGRHGDVSTFKASLLHNPPALASIDAFQELNIEALGDAGFEIRHSVRDSRPTVPVSPDVATCDDCLTEMWDPSQRRHLYAFTNCTNCGPRFTITRRIPYDRSNTSMDAFEMCEDCRAEYEDPGDRRFHAQPLACPRCGPRLQLVAADGRLLPGDPVSETARLIREGGIVAIKGLGGYHLACDGGDEDATRTLRARKSREEKPLAVMVPDLAWAHRLAAIDPPEADLLGSRQRPVVLLSRRPDAPVSTLVAPGNRTLGVMLPYTPLHHLLMDAIRAPIVLTSGNVSDEPIAYRDDDASARLGGIADAILAHDRPIHVRCDDSVVRVVDGFPYFIRRSRGYAPGPLNVVPSFSRPVLGAGPELKHTFCIGLGDRAIVSHHIGDRDVRGGPLRVRVGGRRAGGRRDRAGALSLPRSDQGDLSGRLRGRARSASPAAQWKSRRLRCVARLRRGTRGWNLRADAPLDLRIAKDRSPASESARGLG